MQEIVKDIFKSFISDNFFIIRILYLLKGFIVGLIYGIILSIPASIVYIALYITLGIAGANSSGDTIFLPAIVGIYGALCSSLFFILFGNNINFKLRISFGILGGIIFGFLISNAFSSINLKFENIILLLYSVVFGVIGGVFIAKNSVHHCVKINNLNSTIMNRFKVAFLIIIILFTITSNYDLINKAKNFIIDNDKVYLIVKSNENKSLAIKEAKKWINLGYTDTEVLLTTNGYYAISLGYYKQEKAIHFKKQMIENNIIINSAYLIKNNGVVSSIQIAY